MRWYRSGVVRIGYGVSFRGKRTLQRRRLSVTAVRYSILLAYFYLTCHLLNANKLENRVISCSNYSNNRRRKWGAGTTCSLWNCLQLLLENVWNSRKKISLAFANKQLLLLSLVAEATAASHHVIPSAAVAAAALLLHCSAVTVEIKVGQRRNRIFFYNCTFILLHTYILRWSKKNV